MDKTHIDETAQQVLKIAENVIKNVIKENDGCLSRYTIKTSFGELEIEYR